MNLGLLILYGSGSKPMVYHFGVGASLILVYFSGDWDVHWGYGILTHGHIGFRVRQLWSTSPLARHSEVVRRSVKINLSQAAVLRNSLMRSEGCHQLGELHLLILSLLFG